MLSISHLNVWWVQIKSYPRIFPHSFSVRDQTESIFEMLWLKNEWFRVLWIDGSQFSPNIKLIDLREIQFKNDVELLEAWTDWVIVTWLNSWESSDIETRLKVSLILWVADCAPIWFSTSDWNTIWLIHAWYKWVFSWIIWNFLSILEELWIKFNNIEWEKTAEIYIWPMAWSDFELPRDYYQSLYDWFSDWNPCFDPDDYFSYNWDWKWFFDLRNLIKDILRNSWISVSKYVTCSSIDTTNPNNIWPSYRLHCISKSLLKSLSWKDFQLLPDRLKVEKVMEIYWLNRQQAILFLSKHPSIFLEDRRLATVVSNEFFLI